MLKKILFILAIVLPCNVLAENVYVSVRETQLRPKADFLSKGPYLKYGDMLTIINEQSSWLNVKTGYGKQGFVHRSAVTERRIVLKNTSGPVFYNSTQSEVALAGKGFSKEVENQFASQNHALNFREVDAMERPRVAPVDLTVFIAQGKLNGGVQ